MSRTLTSALVVCLAWPTSVAAAGPADGPRRRSAEPPAVGDISQAGTRHGALELGLGALLTGTAGALLGFGMSQYLHARAQASFCAAGGGSSGIDPCVFDSPSLGYASAGLSWGLSALSLVGAGLLYARGARVHADARAYARMQVSVFASPRSGGATLLLRF